MRKHIDTALFVAVQAASSALSFVLISTIAKAAGSEVLGSVAVVQSIAMIALACGRAIGVDVWAARGGHTRPGDERDALAASLTFAVVPTIVGLVFLVLSNNISFVAICYAVSVPFFVCLDPLRILLLHRSLSWVSFACLALVFLGVAVGGYIYLNAERAIIIYGAGLIVTVGVSLIALRITPPLPSLGYSKMHSEKSKSFLFEISLGTVAQQAMFVVVAVLATIDVAAVIRISQTVLGPLSVIFSGCAPVLLRKFGREGVAELDRVRSTGPRTAGALGVIGLFVILLTCAVLTISIDGNKLVSLVFGSGYENIIPVVFICGLGVAASGVTLGYGTALRVLGLTSRLNRIRCVWLPLQFAVTACAAVTGLEVLAASALSFSSLVTAAISVWVFHRAGAGDRSERLADARNN